MQNNVDRKIEVVDGDVIATTTSIYKMNKALIFRELERCMSEQERLLNDVRRIKEMFENAKEQERLYRQALAVADQNEEYDKEDINKVIDELTK